MKKLLIILAIVCCAFGVVSSAQAALISFDFAALANGSNALAISNYMSGLYGNTVTVTGAISSTDADLLGTSGGSHIENATASGQNVVHGFSILFSTPITSVEFNWARESDLNFYAEADGVEFFHNGTVTGSQNASGHLNTYTFATPVSLLYFHDNYTGETEIDNLIVNKVATPEPATMSLLGLGLLGLFGFGKRKI